MFNKMFHALSCPFTGQQNVPCPFVPLHRLPSPSVAFRRPQPPSTALQEAAAEGDRPPLPRDGGYLLHAFRATLPHPASGELVSFEAEPPPELALPGEPVFRGGEL